MHKGLLATLSLTIAVLLGLLTGYAFAHDSKRADLTDWFMSLRNKRNVPCCDGSDATKLSDVDWDSTIDGKHFRVRINGHWVQVPDDSVLTEPNKDGPAMVWIYPKGADPIANPDFILCFMPGAGA